MKLEDALKMDFSKMSPQQRSHLRKRLLQARMPLPPELELKNGQHPAPVPPDNGPWKCTVVAGDVQRTYTVGPDDEIQYPKDRSLADI